MADSGLPARLRLPGAKLVELKLDAVLISGVPNVRYLTGFTGSNGLLLALRDSALFFTDPRYGAQAAEEVQCRTKICTGPLLDQAAAVIHRRKLKHVGFEKNRLSYEGFALLKSKLPARVSLEPLAGIIEELRMVKSAEEIALIRESVALNSRAFEAGVSRINERATETDLAAELEYHMRRAGAERPAFDTIVASGARAALPHAQPTAAIVRSGRMLLVDMGATVRGYASDMTRMLFPRAPGGKLKRLYRAVLEAQLAAIDAVRPGVTAGQVDQVARKVLKKEGLDRAFVHSTGHGLGLEIHEAPRLGKKDATPLAKGMAITIEPGVYLEGFGGIRIEDTVVVTDTGCEVLTPTPKELRQI